MRDTLLVRTTNALTMAVGAWLVLAPLWFSTSGNALWSQLIVGGGLFVFGAVQMLTESTLPSWITALAGLALVATPFVATVSTTVLWIEVLSGGAGFLLSAFDGYEIGVQQVHARI